MNTSLATQRRLIAVSSLVTFGVGMYGAYARDETPSARFLIGIGFAFMICSIFADLGNPMGSGFAVLIMVSAILYQGEDVLRSLNKRGATKSKRGKRKRRKKTGQKSSDLEAYGDSGDYPKGRK